MFEGITIFERMIIESLESSEQTFESLVQDTSLHLSLLKCGLNNLINKNVIRFKDQKYCLNDEEKSKWLETINNDKNIELEFQELLESILKITLRNKNKNTLKIKKVFMDERDQLTLKAMFSNIETYVLDLEKRSKFKKSKTFTKNVILFGQAFYSDIAQTSLRP